MSSRYLAHYVLKTAATQAAAELASGTGSALNASVLIVPRAELASGTGSALDATVSTTLNVSANAELASGTGAAGVASASILPNAGSAAGTGAASNATVRIGLYAPAGAASGTGSAHNATTLAGPTRFYLNTRGWPQVRPAVDSGWENANLALELWHSRRMMRTWHGGSAELSPFGIDNQAAIHDLLMAQYISEPLAAQTISGTIRAVIQASESNSAANMRSQMHAWVMKPDGTSRGTLTTFTTGALASEWNTSQRSAFFPVGSTGTTVSNVTAQLGDRIVVDLGARIHDTSATQYFGRLYLGDYHWGGAGVGTTWDLPSNQTDTTSTHNGWIEFSAGLVFQTAPLAIVDDIASAIDCMPAAEGSVTAYAADISGFTTEADDPTSMADVNYSLDLGFTGWAKLVGPTGGAIVKVEGGGGLGVEPFVYVFDDPPTSGSAYELYNESADFNSNSALIIDVPDGVTKYVAIMPGDGSFESFDADKNVYLEFKRARSGEIADLIADAPDLLPATENSDTVAFSPDVDFWTTEADDPQYIIDNVADPLGFTGWFKLDVPAGPGTKIVDIDTYLPIDYAEGPENTALFVFDEVPTISSLPVAEAYSSPDGSPPAGSIDQSWAGKAKIAGLELHSGFTYYVAVVPIDGSFWEHWAEGTNLQVTVYRYTDSADVDAFAGVATGTGEAYGPGLVNPQAELATGTGEAYNAYINPSLAEAAAGTGSAFDATALVAPHAGTGNGTGTAYQTLYVGTATGTGAAYDATIYAEDNYGATPEGDIATGYMPPLAAPIDDNDTTIVVQYPSTTAPDVPFVVIIDGEEVLVTAVSPDGLTWTVVRGHNATTATSHGSGAVARPALVNIRVDGVLISPDVDYRRSRFTTAANGQPGTAEIWVRDLDRTHAFVTGAEVRVSFRGIRQWGGYVASIRREYVFPAGTGRIGDEPRWLLLDCVDYNVLFNKRLFYKLSDPTYMKVKHWPNGTWDSVVISDVVRDHLNIGADNLRFDIQHVGTPALPQISCDPNAPDRFGVGSAGWTWGQVMQAISSQTGAVYYIDPDKVFRYVDDSDKQSRFGWDGLSDDPDNVNTIGYRDVEFTLDGTRLTNDHLQWGAGQGRDEMVFHRSTNQPSIDEHGLWQTAEVRFDLYCQDSVDQRAQTWVYGSPQNRRGGKDDRFFSRVTVREPYFRVADVVELESTEFGFNETAPVRNAEITFPTPWDIKVILTIAHEIDAPWSTLEFWMPQFSFDFDFDFKMPVIGDIWWPPPWDIFDPCDPICDEPGEPIFGCIDTFTRSEASGLGTGELGAWTPNVNYKVELNRGVALRNATGGTEATITDHTITSPGCIRWDTRPFGTSSGSFGGGMVLAARQGNRVPASILYMSYSIRLNYAADGSMIVQYSALGDDTTSFTDRGVSGTTVIADYPVDEDVTWELHFSDDEIRVVGYPTLTPGAIILDVTRANDPVIPSTGHYHLGFVDQIVVYNALTTDVGSAGEEAFEFDNINVCCDQGCGGYEGSTAGAELGLFGATSWPAGWTDFDFFAGPKQMTDELNVNMVGGSGTFTSYLQDVNNGVGAVALNLGPPYDPDEDFEVLVHLTINDPGKEWELMLNVAANPAGPGEPYTDYHGTGVKPLDTINTPPGEYLWRVGVTTDGTVSSRWWAVGDTEPVSTNTIFTGGALAASPVPRVIQLWLRNDSNTIPVDLASVRVTAIEVNPGSASPGGDPPNPCADAEPGELEDPLHDGPNVGEGADTTFEVGDNGGIIFHTDEQFQVGSTEVWVNGLRIRIGADYIEYPRQAMIEILDHIDVGTEGDPATVLVNYIIWTIDDPMPE